MTVDLDLYKVSKQAAQRWYITKGHNHEQMAVSMMSLLTGAPCIVSAYWIGEVTGWPEWVKNTIDELTKFYQYKDIKNKPENCPY